MIADEIYIHFNLKARNRTPEYMTALNKILELHDGYNEYGNLVFDKESQEELFLLLLVNKNVHVELMDDTRYGPHTYEFKGKECPSYI